LLELSKAMKKLFFLLYFISTLAYTQENKSTSIGNTTIDELKMVTYSKDSSANALVLYEHANFYLTNNKKKRFTTDYYYRIKILKNEGLKKGVFTFGISLEDKLTGVKAITYNLKDGDSLSMITSIVFYLYL
jgi:formylmethanofuran dehydrogenase subunit E-like metal-binding protein